MAHRHRSTSRRHDLIQTPPPTTTKDLEEPAPARPIDNAHTSDANDKPEDQATGINIGGSGLRRDDRLSRCPTSSLKSDT